MKNTMRRIAAVVASVGALSAQAATQGNPSTTSSQADFIVTAAGPATPRVVQVLNVSDVTITNTTRTQVEATKPGITMAFCLVDTYGGTVRLNVASTNGVGEFRLLSSGGVRLKYLVRITDPSNSTNFGGEVTSATSFSVPVTAVGTVSNASNCGAGGTTKAHI
jgi:hypothetical protein